MSGLAPSHVERTNGARGLPRSAQVPGLEGSEGKGREEATSSDSTAVRMPARPGTLCSPRRDPKGWWPLRTRAPPHFRCSLCCRSGRLRSPSLPALPLRQPPLGLPASGLLLPRRFLDPLIAHLPNAAPGRPRRSHEPVLGLRGSMDPQVPTPPCVRRSLGSHRCLRSRGGGGGSRSARACPPRSRHRCRPRPPVPTRRGAVQCRPRCCPSATACQDGAGEQVSARTHGREGLS